MDGFKTESQYYKELVTLSKSTNGKIDDIKVASIKRLLNLENHSLNSESLSKFKANFECQIRSLWKLNLTLDEFSSFII